MELRACETSTCEATTSKYLYSCESKVHQRANPCGKWRSMHLLHVQPAYPHRLPRVRLESQIHPERCARHFGGRLCPCQLREWFICYKGQHAKVRHLARYRRPICQRGRRICYYGYRMHTATASPSSSRRMGSCLAWKPSTSSVTCKLM